ncbi:MAG: hypothetical protein V3W41_11100 [Planctomycetota bacterium]
MGSMASFRLSDRDAPSSDPLAIDPLQEALFRDHQIEVPVMPFPTPSGRTLRISAQVYNQVSDYERLAKALKSLV